MTGVEEKKKQIEQVDFGVKFLVECNEYMKRMKSKEACTEVKIIKERCQSMLEEALHQVSSRVPPGAHVFRDLAKLNPNIVLNQTVRSQFSELSFINFAESNNLNKIEEQYGKILFVDWKKKDIFKEGVPADTEKF